MTVTIKQNGERRLDFAFGPEPKRPDALAAFRLSDVRRSAGARSAMRAYARRAPEARHLHWRAGLVRLRDV